MQEAATRSNLKRVTLELGKHSLYELDVFDVVLNIGGKSPLIICEDADRTYRLRPTIKTYFRMCRRTVDTRKSALYARNRN